MSNNPRDEKRQPTTQEVARSEPIEDRKKSDAGESDIQDDIKDSYPRESKEANSQMVPLIAHGALMGLWYSNEG